MKKPNAEKIVMTVLLIISIIFIVLVLVKFDYIDRNFSMPFLPAPLLFLVIALLFFISILKGFGSKKTWY